MSLIPPRSWTAINPTWSWSTASWAASSPPWKPVTIPTLALVHSSPGALAPPGGPIDGLVIGELNRIRSALELRPVDSYWQAWQQHDVICASIPELDPLGTDTLHPVTWIGPIFEDLTRTDWMSEDHDDTPLVLVSFYSGGAWDQTSRIQRTIDGLAGADLRVIVTTGAVDPTQLHVPSKAIEIVPHIPHAAILPYASAVVTHAGHGTLTAALAHGLPIVAIPNQAADQPALAEQAAHLGAGIHLHDHGATPTDIAPAVRTVIDDPTYATNARALGDRIDTYSNQPRAAVEHILGHAEIARQIHPLPVATGEHVANRVIFKQMLQAGSLSVLQIDASRVAGVNENIAILLLAAKFGVPVCPHAGGVGLCEAVQHLSMFDYVAVSGSLAGRRIEYVDHLHEHLATPVELRRGRYLAPLAAGAGTEMLEDSLTRFAYPDGAAWCDIEDSAP